MNKKLNSGLALILPNKKVNLFVIFIVILGIISGSLFLMVLNEMISQKLLMRLVLLWLILILIILIILILLKIV